MVTPPLNLSWHCKKSLLSIYATLIRHLSWLKWVELLLTVDQGATCLRIKLICTYRPIWTSSKSYDNSINFLAKYSYRCRNPCWSICHFDNAHPLTLSRLGWARLTDSYHSSDNSIILSCKFLIGVENFVIPAEIYDTSTFPAMTDSYHRKWLEKSSDHRDAFFANFVQFFWRGSNRSLRTDRKWPHPLSTFPDWSGWNFFWQSMRVPRPDGFLWHIISHAPFWMIAVIQNKPHPHPFLMIAVSQKKFHPP